MITKDLGLVLSNHSIAEDIYEMKLHTQCADEARPGQFVNLYLNDSKRLLPRPISICRILPKEESIVLVYRVVGDGTKELADLSEGSRVEVMGPLGNGYTLPGDLGKSHPLLIGGGLGIPPMLGLAQAVSHETECTVVLGYRDELFLQELFEKTGANVVIATDSGSHGTKGTVLDAIGAENVTGDVIYSCGPKPMLRGVKEFALQEEIPCYISMEERMACGVGACLGCVVKTTKKHHHTNVNNARVCKDGPVFDAREVDLS